MAEEHVKEAERIIVDYLRRWPPALRRVEDIAADVAYELRRVGLIASEVAEVGQVFGTSDPQSNTWTPPSLAEQIALQEALVRIAERRVVVCGQHLADLRTRMVELRQASYRPKEGRHA